jgi:hypothetical protein
MNEATIWGGIVLLSVLALCTVALLITLACCWWRKETHRHAEAMQKAIATKDIGCTAWHTSDVHKSVLIREQEKRIAELEGWKARTEKRMSDLHISEVFDHE